MYAANSEYERENSITFESTSVSRIIFIFHQSRAQEHLTNSVAYTASINAKVVTAIPTAGPFSTAIRGFGKSINVSIKSLTKVMLKLNLVIYFKQLFWIGRKRFPYNYLTGALLIHYLVLDGLLSVLSCSWQN